MLVHTTFFSLRQAVKHARHALVRDHLLILSIHEVELPALLVLPRLSHVDEERRGVVLILDDLLAEFVVPRHNTVEEGHGRAHTSHLVLIIVVSLVVARIWCSIGVLEWVDEGVQGEPEWNELVLVSGDEDDLLLTEQVREYLDDRVSGDTLEQQVEEAVADVGQVV